VPKDIDPASHAKKTPTESESPRVDKPPSPPAGKSTPETSKPLSLGDTEDPTGAKGTPTSPSDASLGRDTAPQFTNPKPTEHSKLLVDVSLVKAHPCQGPENNHVNIHVSQSTCGTIQTLFRPDFTLASTYQRS
jgi:hypothetical protein